MRGFISQEWHLQVIIITPFVEFFVTYYLVVCIIFCQENYQVKSFMLYNVHTTFLICFW